MNHKGNGRMVGMKPTFYSLLPKKNVDAANGTMLQYKLGEMLLYKN